MLANSGNDLLLTEEAPTGEAETGESSEIDIIDGKKPRVKHGESMETFVSVFHE